MTTAPTIALGDAPVGFRGRITALDLPGQITEALSLGIISESEAAQLRDYDAKVQDIINVDDFASHELGVGADAES